ncbi:hypothetical protein Tco_0057624 [Tanacetum coccineum]
MYLTASRPDITFAVCACNDYVMAILVISVSSDSSEDTFHQLFLSSADDTTNSDTPDTPPSPTHGMPFTEITSSTQRSPVIPRHSSSEASLDFHLDASSDSSSRHSLSDHSSPDLPSTSAGPSRKRCRSPMTFSVRILVNLKDDVIVRVSDEPHLEQDINPEIQAEIDECFAYADALRDREIDARVVVEAVDRNKTETDVRGLVEVRVKSVTHLAMPEEIPKSSQEGAVEAIKGVQREQGHRIVGVESTVTALTKRVAELERDNRRLRGTVSVESQRVD